MLFLLSLAKLSKKRVLISSICVNLRDQRISSSGFILRTSKAKKKIFDADRVPVKLLTRLLINSTSAMYLMTLYFVVIIDDVLILKP
jgi:hypothetical protein